MKKRTLEEKGKDWVPEEDDKFGEDKVTFVNYLINNCKGLKNSKSISNIIANVEFTKNFSKEELQHNIIVPLRESGEVFIGTSNKGIYFIDSSEDAKKTLDFYANRIRSELKHLRNLKKIIRKNDLFKNLKPKKDEKTKINIYFDESGTPSLKNLENDPFFIVTAIVIESDRNKPILELDKKFKFIREVLNKKSDFEFKSTRLKQHEYKKTLIELSTIDYEFASIIFDKAKLNSAGFNNAKSFYKFSFDYLLKELFDYVGGTINLYFDQYSSEESIFQKEFEKYIKNKNLGYYLKDIDNLGMFNSNDHPFIQIADLISGVLKNFMKRKSNLFDLVEEKCIFIRRFPL
ncbi:DUF3800 domain-containing protein [Leptospira levettii]|uniref:DUF3800 domain-containing protein n=1 Tax=Leptospira levettii TaxID=2023178 RepID=UPI00223E7B0F|nr:DUF3800 domain-containing protein [Leptospira levettii]MCW7475610.1 DUF3800 domain-containing protein [Leptospira levettii]